MQCFVAGVSVCIYIIYICKFALRNLEADKRIIYYNICTIMTRFLTLCL